MLILLLAFVQLVFNMPLRQTAFVLFVGFSVTLAVFQVEPGGP